MQDVVKGLLKTVAGIEAAPNAAHNIRVDGKSISRQDSENITIVPRESGDGITVTVAPNTKGEQVYIPALIQAQAYTETVYNDFYIGEDCEVTVVAGCGIHCSGDDTARHDGVHAFHVGARSLVKYVENHYGEGEGGKRLLNPVTEVFLAEGSRIELEMVQIEGVDDTNRITKATIGDNATLVVKEKLMTSGEQHARTEFEVNLNGEGASCNVSSRAVAKGHSTQLFVSNMNGNNDCLGHSECDAIIMDSASVQAIPVVTANHASASLIHEAAIGKIAGEQIVKLMTLGLNREEAEQHIIAGFLK